MHPYREDGEERPRNPDAPLDARYTPIGPAAHRLLQLVRTLPALLGLAYFSLAFFGVSFPRSPRVLILLAIFAGAQLLVMMVVRQTLLALSERQAMVSALLEAGQVGAAVGACEALIADARAHPAWHSVFVTDCANLALISGDLELATRLLDVVERAGWFARAEHHRASAILLASMARVAVARGDLARADWLAREARARMPPLWRIDLAALDALLDLRDGRAALAATRLAEAWPIAERRLRGPQRKALMLLRAYAIEASGGDVEDARAWVERAKPVHAWNVATLRVGWPAFEEFLALHGLPEGP